MRLRSSSSLRLRSSSSRRSALFLFAALAFVFLFLALTLLFFAPLAILFLAALAFVFLLALALFLFSALALFFFPGPLRPPLRARAPRPESLRDAPLFLLASLGVEPLLLELAFYRLFGFPRARVRLPPSSAFGSASTLLRISASSFSRFSASSSRVARPPRVRSRACLLCLGATGSFLFGRFFGLFARLRCGCFRGLALGFLALVLLGLRTLIEARAWPTWPARGCW